VDEQVNPGEQRSCFSCGQPADDGDRFCSQCGAPLPVTAVEAPAETTSMGTAGPASSGALPAVGSGYVTGVDAGASVLVVSRGPGAGSSYLLTGDIVTAGRSPEADLFLDDITVSRHHVEFRRAGQSWSVADQDSLNGTYVNRQRVEKHTLQPGDEVQIGKYRFAYLVGGE
jgi:hypothetical protein